jgi:hypothetical protein
MTPHLSFIWCRAAPLAAIASRSPYRWAFASSALSDPSWIVQVDRETGRLSGRYHLDRGGRRMTTLCGIEKRTWHIWPRGMGRPTVEMCCLKCMRIATNLILGGMT